MNLPRHQHGRTDGDGHSVEQPAADSGSVAATSRPAAVSGGPAVVPGGSAPVPTGSTAAVDKSPDRRRGDVLTGAATALGVAAAGVPAGLLWSVLAPHARVVIGAGGPDLADPNTKAFIAADGIFLFLTVAGGLLSAVLAWLLGGRRHGVATALGLAVGGLAASYVAWRVGHRIGLAEFRRALRGPPGTSTLLAVSLRAKGVLVGWALAGVLTVLALAVRARASDGM